MTSRVGPTGLILVLLSTAFDFLATPIIVADIFRRRRTGLPRARALKRRLDED